MALQKKQQKKQEDVRTKKEPKGKKELSNKETMRKFFAYVILILFSFIISIVIYLIYQLNTALTNSLTLPTNEFILLVYITALFDALFVWMVFLFADMYYYLKPFFKSS